MPKTGTLIRPHRMRILELHREDPNRTQSSIARELGTSQAMVSYWLRKFHRDGMCDCGAVFVPAEQK